MADKPRRRRQTSYRRRALAEWITDRQLGAGRSVARVEVNRLWQFHIGRGIVATPSDFGARGEPPTHPELLDWLAGELIAGGWRLKPIHKQIVMSAAYMQSAAANETNAKADPDNRTFWRHPTQRLEAEVIRDALLAVSGVLDPTMFGPGTLDPASRRRSIYFTVKRSKLIPMLTIFDAPDALGGVGQRPTTTVAPQALYLDEQPASAAIRKGLRRPNCAELQRRSSTPQSVPRILRPSAAIRPPTKRPIRSPSSTRNRSRTSRLAKPTPVSSPSPISAKRSCA